MPNIIKSVKPYFDKGLYKMVYSEKDRIQKMEAMGLKEGGGGKIDRDALELLEQQRESKYENRKDNKRHIV